MTRTPDQVPSAIDHELVRGLIAMYSRGLFPMADPDTGEIHWFDPPRRGVIPMDAFRVPRSLAQRVRSGRFKITTDTAFEAVIDACSKPRPTPVGESWIDDRIKYAYTQLHRAGYAHSVEAWVHTPERPRLVGGLYGVAIGGLFAGESMFSRPAIGGTDASKVCLVHLVGHLRARGFVLLDTQFVNPHLEQFNCVEISRSAYHDQLRRALESRCEWLPFECGG